MTLDSCHNLAAHAGDGCAKAGGDCANGKKPFWFKLLAAWYTVGDGVRNAPQGPVAEAGSDSSATADSVTGAKQ
jgi:hypothetical protein